MSLNTTPRTFVTAEVETAAIFNAEVRDALTGIQAAWTAYTPTVANMTLGNGTVSGRYSQVGKTVTLQFRLAAGSTTTYTTNPATFGLPSLGNANVTLTEVYGIAKLWTGSGNFTGLALLAATSFTIFFPTNSTTVALAASGFNSTTLNPGTTGNVSATLVYELA